MKMNQRGITMVSTLIAAGMAGGLALIVAQVLQMGDKGVKRIESRSEMSSTNNLIAQMLETLEIVRQLSSDKIYLQVQLLQSKLQAVINILSARKLENSQSQICRRLLSLKQIQVQEHLKEN